MNPKFAECHTKCCCWCVRQQLLGCAARFKTVFPLAVHLGLDCDVFAKINILWEASHEINGVGGALGDRQWKNFSNPLKLTLAAVFHTSESY